jgi:purine-nucleoside phosphorylase
VLSVTDSAGALRLAAALAPRLATRPGRYVAVPGPHYETPAEAAWLRGYGEVVGMSTAAEVRAASGLGVPVCVLSLVANASGAALDHAEVLAAGARLAVGLEHGLGALTGAFMAGLGPAPTGWGASGRDAL